MSTCQSSFSHHRQSAFVLLVANQDNRQFDQLMASLNIYPTLLAWTIAMASPPICFDTLVITHHRDYLVTHPGGQPFPETDAQCLDRTAPTHLVFLDQQLPHMAIHRSGQNNTTKKATRTTLTMAKWWYKVIQIEPKSSRTTCSRQIYPSSRACPRFA